MFTKVFDCKENIPVVNPQQDMLASRPLAAVGGQSLRQPLIQHPDIAFTQGVDEGRGIRTAVKHLAAFGIQGVYLDIEGVLEYP